MVNEAHPGPLVTYDQSSPQLPLRSCDIGKVEQIGNANRLPRATFCLAVAARPRAFPSDLACTYWLDKNLSTSLDDHVIVGQ